ncbi:MAG: response regulator, partial [Desulfovibrio sp.]|nr:response regulator [Desulfovibrio sp.]
MGKRAMVSTLHCSRKLSLVCLFFVSLVFCRVPLAAQILPSDLHGECIPFLPYLEYTLDEKGSLDIEALALQEKSLTFQPVRSLDFAPETGTFWLRFTIGPLAEGAKPMEWLLSLGESLPGDPKLYIPEIQPQTGMQQWRIVHVTDRHILNLPEAGNEAKTCFIRLDGPPGLWFAPMLRSPHNAANNWGALARPAAVLVLAILVLLSLLRCFSEKGQWRLWTVLFVGCALAAGYMGLPTLEKGHIGFGQFARVLAPGLALMLLPHVARHMMRTQHFSRLIDAQLIVLTLVGACVTLVPLVPGFSWTARFLELWPLVTIFYIPTALWALFLGIPTALHFLIICLLPPLFTAAGLLGLLSGLSADILAAFPLFGIACSALLLVASHSPEQDSKKENKGNETIMLKDQLDDPNLRIIAFDQPKATVENQEKPKTAEKHSIEHKLSSEMLENLQQPVDLLLSEATHLEECALPPAVRVHAKNMVDQAKRLWNLVKGCKENDNCSAQEEDGSCDL